VANNLLVASVATALLAVDGLFLWHQVKAAHAYMAAVDDARQARTRILIVIQHQRTLLDGVKVGGNRVAVPAKAPKEMKAALNALNKSIAESDAMAVAHKAGYKKMLDDMENAVMGDKPQNSLPGKVP
jgi:hypothetical protein